MTSAYSAIAVKTLRYWAERRTYAVISVFKRIAVVLTSNRIMNIQKKPDHMPFRSYLLGAMCALIAKEIYRKSQKYHDVRCSFAKIMRKTSGIVCDSVVSEARALSSIAIISFPFGKIKYIKSVSIPTPNIIGAAPIKKFPSV